MKTLVSLLTILFLTGCAKYEYDLIRPEAHARHIGSKSAEVFTIDPLEYHLQTAESRLVMLVYNHTETPVELLGGKSYLVTPAGESKPLRNVTIAPGSFIKFIMPPFRPRVERVGPSIGFGFGMSSGGHSGSGVGVGVGSGIGDDYYTYTEDSAFFWQWSGETDVRLNITYKQGEQVFSNEFVFHRVKM